MGCLSGTPSYIGRFAPSPSGALHFGSLLAALASYLDARSHNGRWLLRMEDLDPAREPPGAADQILRTLDVYGLHWDGDVVYQSTRLDAYQDALDRLEQVGLTFRCTCSRKRVHALGGVYDGKCRQRKSPPRQDYAIRMKVDDIVICVEDQIQGLYQQQLKTHCGDFILRRRDGLFAYQLAVVVDDAWQQITDIVRGYDLLESTPRQIWLQSCLQLPLPRYAHLPVASNEDGQKLSKQHFSRALSLTEGANMIRQALSFLAHPVPSELSDAPVSDILPWAIRNWDIQRVPKLANIVVSPQLS
ncbi:tRNA glutamyl-Q(34) synthetase GluQRS [Pseudohongiella spirulinae]|uniref:Glutamyl-Q tRNA(Asp) synthetase n=1 Tax=Pseudohongiella spirulinae TaxID=1249552 RepID=A0A0S2KF79_9GAMM|nr:tRNA glutamyl-Q(34) synthetase GluQRS [Pseudohongiella spirulinae]ALO46988.1 Glutamyl-Q tRNA(Asp) synthetase [Pseudohongiella spirulinae]